MRVTALPPGYEKTTLPPFATAIFMYTDPIFSTTWKFDFSSLCNDETDYVAFDNTTKFVR